MDKRVNLNGAVVCARRIEKQFQPGDIVICVRDSQCCGVNSGVEDGCGIRK
jgi:hypothetical protein